MIAIDTNVLLRYLLDDDSDQSPRAAALFDGDQEILITDAVLVETIWTLKGKKYKVDRESLALVISKLFEEPSVSFEDGQTVWRALGDFRKCTPVKVGGKKKSADFADALILNKAIKFAEDRGRSLDALFTFDRAFLALSKTKLP